MGGNNILDSSAMQTISEIKTELPHIREAMERLARAQIETNSSVREIERMVNGICTRQAVADTQRAVNTEKIKVLELELDVLKEKVTVLDTKDKIIGGANAIFTTVASIITATVTQAMK